MAGGKVLSLKKNECWKLFIGPGCEGGDSAGLIIGYKQDDEVKRCKACKKTIDKNSSYCFNCKIDMEIRELEMQTEM